MAANSAANNNNSGSSNADKKNEKSGADLMELCLANWRWFVVSLCLCIGLAVVKIVVTEPSYDRQATVLIKDDNSSGGLSQMAAAFSDLGGFSTTSNVNNELEAFKSPALMLDVIDRLGLDCAYTRLGLVRNTTLYGPNLPFLFSFPDANPNARLTVWGEMSLKGDLKLTKFRFQYKKTKDTYKKEIPAGTINTTDSLSTPIGPVVVSPNPRFVKKALFEDLKKPMKFKVVWTSPIDVAFDMENNLKADLADEMASVITLNYPDVSTARAEDILNTLIDVYNLEWMKDKNLMNVATSNFIEERLRVIEQELGEVDNDVTDYQMATRNPNIEANLEFNMKRLEGTDEQMISISSRLALVRQVRDYLSNPDNANKLLPTVTGTENRALEQAIIDYNTLVLDRDKRLQKGATANNPVIADYNNRIAGTKEAILQSIDHEIAGLNQQTKALGKARSQSSDQVYNTPKVSRGLLEMARNRKVKSDLYLYLLEKREENQLSQAFTAYNTRMLTPPMGERRPVAPAKAQLLLIAFLIGVLAPMGLLMLRENLDHGVRSRREVEAATRVPIAGELPHHGSKPGFIKRVRSAVRHRRGLDEPDEKPSEIVVRHGEHNPTNEAFRMLRSNLQQMDAPHVKQHPGQAVVTMVTSAIPGSGKTFVSLNLASAVSLKGKKVAIVDLDLRKGTLSKLAASPVVGASAVLTGDAKLPDVIVRNLDGIDNLDLVPAGATPPNPAEILDTPALKQMFDDLRSRYDAVIVDCPPSEAVTDAQIISPETDRTIYVVRLGHLHREFLPEIERFFEEKRYQNLTLVLNDSEVTTRGYGYGYGYGYGSSASASDTKKK